MKPMLLKLHLAMDQAWKKFKIILQKNDALLFLLAGLTLAFLLRMQLRSYESKDATSFLLKWFDFIKNNNGFWALKNKFANYNVPYLYLLVISVWFQSLVAISRLLAIKLISICFDFVGAYFVAKIIGVKYSSRSLRIAGALIYLFLPTVFLNSAMWGQADGIYTAFTLATLYFLLVGRNNLAMLAFGLAFSFKLQAVWLAPLLLLLVCMSRLSLRSLLIVPATYFVTLVPALIAGRPLMELLRIYIGQTGRIDKLTMNAPTIYALVNNSVADIVDPAGLVLATFVIIFGVYAIYKAAPPINKDLLVTLSAVSVLIVPYVLPRMHERYFYLAETFLLVLAFYRPKTFLFPIILQIVSWSTYRGYFFEQELFPLWIGALVLLGALVYLIYFLVGEVKESQRQAAISPNGSE